MSAAGALKPVHLLVAGFGHELLKVRAGARDSLTAFAYDLEPDERGYALRLARRR